MYKIFRDGIKEKACSASLLKRWPGDQLPVVQKWHVPKCLQRRRSDRVSCCHPCLGRTCRCTQLLQISERPWHMKHEWQGRPKMEPEIWWDRASWMWHIPDSHVWWGAPPLRACTYSSRSGKCHHITGWISEMRKGCVGRTVATNQTINESKFAWKSGIAVMTFSKRWTLGPFNSSGSFVWPKRTITAHIVAA